MYKLIVSDLDETLLVGQRVPQFNIDAVKKAQELGVKFVPCTGRGHDMVGDILEDLGIANKKDEYLIAYNGAMIIHNYMQEQLYFNGLSYEVAKKLFDYGRKHDVCLMCFTQKGTYFFNAHPNEVKRKIEQKAAYTVVDHYDFSILKDASICKFIFMNYDNDMLHEIGEHAPDDIKEVVEIAYSSNRYLEFNNKGVSKGAALKWLANYLNIDIQDTIAIGDNYNDISMMQEAGLSVAVACAEDEIKAICDYTTKLNYDEGAVQEMIEKFVLK